MTTFLGSVLKQFVPGSLAFLVLGFAGALLIRRFLPEWKNHASAILTLLLGFYVLLALPWTAYTLAAPLDRYPQLRDPAQARGATTLVVLHGDYKAARVAEASRLYRLLRPRTVVLLAPAADMRNALIAAGVPASQLQWHARSRNTRGQMQELASIMRDGKIRRVVLVASPVHMPRIVGLSNMLGLDVVPAVAFRTFGEPPRGVRNVIPGTRSFVLSYEALYEHMALGLYRMRGWI